MVAYLSHVSQFTKLDDQVRSTFASVNISNLNSQSCGKARRIRHMHVLESSKPTAMALYTINGINSILRVDDNSRSSQQMISLKNRVTSKDLLMAMESSSPRTGYHFVLLLFFID